MWQELVSKAGFSVNFIVLLKHPLISDPKLFWLKLVRKPVTCNTSSHEAGHIASQHGSEHNLCQVWLPGGSYGPKHTKCNAHWANVSEATQGIGGNDFCPVLKLKHYQIYSDMDTYCRIYWQAFCFDCGNKLLNNLCYWCFLIKLLLNPAINELNQKWTNVNTFQQCLLYELEAS